ncbi:MAG TPA: FtsQ-type POTRA domain-containing protein [Thermaerobacter sp.]
MDPAGTSLWAQKVRERRRRLRGAALSLLLAAALTAGYLFMRSPLFAVDHVRVKGFERLTPEEIRDLAAIPAGTLIWRLSPDAVARRVESHPRVAGAVVRREWPRGLVIEIRERRPVALLVTRGDPSRWAEVDGQGLVLAAGEGRPPAVPGTVRISGVTAGPFRPGQPVDPDLLPAVQVAAALDAADLRDPARAMRLQPGGTLRLQLASGMEVRWGRADEATADKVRALAAALAELAREPRPATYIDVTYPRRPVLGGQGTAPER